MKGLASLEQTQQFSERSIIETVFSVLKDRLGLVTSSYIKLSLMPYEGKTIWQNRG
jgi:hypothetical protein